MKNLRKNTCILLLITSIIIYLILKDDFVNILNKIFKLNIWLFLIGIVFFFLHLFFKALIFYFIVKKQGKNVGIGFCIKQMFIAQFFNGVTPFATGGQPMQVYLLKKKKMSLIKATNSIVQDYMFYTISLVIIDTIAIILNQIFGFFPEVFFLKIIVIIGYMVNILLVVGIFVISFNEKAGKWLIEFAFKIISKFKFIKNPTKIKEKWLNKVEEFNSNAKYLVSNKKLFVQGILCNMISLIFFYLTPLFIALSMNINYFGVLLAFSASAYVYMIGTIIPIPGASGGLEYGFSKFYGIFIAGSSLSSLLLLWRFITYYLPMIIGGITFSFYKGDEI